MTSDKIVELLKALKIGTETRRVLWEDLPDEEMFRAQVGIGFVRIGKTESGSKKGYALWLIDLNGGIAAEVEFFRGDPGFDLIEHVYTSARLAARNGEMIIDSIIREIGP
jgi:hypothetical protein